MAALALVSSACPSAGSDVDDAARRARSSTAGWFALKYLADPRSPEGLAACESLFPAVSQAATSPGATAPDPHRYTSGERWCVFAPEASPAGPAVRSDAVAQRASGLTGLPAVSFWATDEAWSYAIFDRGEPVFAMESHYGDPQLIGDEARGAALLDLPPGTLVSYRDNADEPAVADALATRVGAGRPGHNAARANLVLPKKAGDDAYDPKKHPPSPRMEGGQWAVLPPLGVVLVKAVNEDGTYVLVDDDKTFPIPIERAGGLGMRRLANAEDVAKALKLVVDGVDAPADVKEYSADRAKVWLDALKLGDLQKIARTFADLCAVQAERKLFAVEQGLLETSREWLAEEIGTVQNKTRDALEAELVDACD